MAKPSVSVIVALHKDNDRFRTCLKELLNLDYPNYEVVIVSDEEQADLPPGAINIATGSPSSTPPGVKRDVGMARTTSRYLAFIDDDAYPDRQWLASALPLLEEDQQVAGVGGPGLTPPDSPFWERVGGAVYESFFGSGPLRFRFLPMNPRLVDDLPAYNFVVRRAALGAVEGWASGFYGGEDTKVCLELVRAGFKLKYSPDVVVYHFRRRVLLPHLRQVANVGRHRGFFMKRFPETSRRPVYLLPTLVAAVTIAAAVGAVIAPSVIPWLAGLAAAYVGVALGSVSTAGPGVALVLPPFVLAHHVAYSIGFLEGLFTKDLRR